MKNFIKKAYSNVINIIGVVVIITTSIVIIMWANGYQINLKSGVLTETGILRINTNIPNASIYLGNVYEGKTPLIITSLLPGTYKIMIKKQNYTSWESLVSVKFKQITNLDAFLFPTTNTENKLTLPNDTLQMTSNINSQNILITTQGNSGNKIYYTNPQSQNTNPSFLLNLSQISNFNSQNYSITPNDSFSYILINPNTQNNTDYYLYNISNNSVVDISTQYNIDLFSKIQWINDNVLLLQNTNNNILATFNVNDNSVNLIYSSNQTTNIPYSSYNTNQIIYSIYNTSSHTSSIYTENLDGSNKTQIYRTNFNINNIYTSNNSNYVVLTSKTNSILLNTQTMKPINLGKNINNVEFSPDNLYILIQKNNQLWVYYIENNSQSVLINNLTPVSNITWYPLGGYIFFETKGNGHLGINNFTLWSQAISSNTKRKVTEGINKGYFITPNGQTLLIKQNLPSNSNYINIYSIDLIKQTSIFPFSL